VSSKAPANPAVPRDARVPQLSAPRDQTKTREAAELYELVRKHLHPLVSTVEGNAVFPLLVMPHEDGQEVNDAYHQVRTRPFAYSDGGYPVAVFLPGTAAQVAALVTGLKQMRSQLDMHSIKVSVAGGCHGPLSMAERCVCIDLQRINHVKPDVAKKLVSVGGGCKLRDVNQALHGTGFGISTGTNSDTGVGGLTLAGGMGFISRKHGLGCDNVVQASVVLASGELVHCRDDNEHKDLLCALRGGGGNFGVVVEFVFDMHDVAACLGGLCLQVVPSKARLVTALKAWAEISTSTPDYAVTLAVAPTGAPVLVTVAAAVGPDVKGKKVKDVEMFGRLNALKGALFRVAPQPFRELDFNLELQCLLEPFAKRGKQISTGFCIQNLDDAMIETIAHFVRVDTPPSTSALILFPMGHKVVTGLPGRPNCVGHRENAFWLIVEAIWSSEAQKPAAIEWQTRIMKRVRELGAKTTAHTFEYADVQQAYTGHNKAVLKLAKNKYDASNFWRMNVNIVPDDLGHKDSTKDMVA
jgi:FAD/FMN-containing dehydrogenase